MLWELHSKANKKRKRKQYYYFSRRLSEAKELDILLQDAEPRTFLQFRNVIDKWNHDNENNTEDKNTINDTTNKTTANEIMTKIKKDIWNVT